MTQLSGAVVVVAQDIFDEKTSALHNVGALIHTNDGRSYRYAKAGGTALVAGTLQQAPVEDTGDQDIAATAAAIGDVEITTAAMTVTANQYAGGWVNVTVTPGVGIQYQINSHAAFTAAAATFKLDDSIQVALTSTSRLDFVTNPYNGVIINPTTATSAPVGVAVKAITAASYGWVQTGGVANILNDGGSTVGTNVSASNGIAGAVEPAATAQAAVGVAVTGIATTEYGAIKLFGL